MLYAPIYISDEVAKEYTDYYCSICTAGGAGVFGRIYYLIYRGVRYFAYLYLLYLYFKF